MTDQHPAPQEDEINLLDYVIVVLKHKEFIIKTTLAAMALAAVVSLVIPPTYQAETKILPPSGGGSSMASLMMAQMGGLGFPQGAFFGKTNDDLYVSLLVTRPVEDYVIDKFGLMNEYGATRRDLVRQKLADNLTTSIDRKSGIVTLGFTSRSPQQAADIDNAFVEGLQNLNNNLALTDAAQRRLFFEEQLKIARDKLVASENALKSFQQRTGTIKLDDEAKAAVENIAQLRAQVTAKEVQISAMRAYATTDNPDLQRLQDEAAALRGELAKMESRGQAGDGPVSSVGNISSLSTEYLSRMRDYKYKESLYEILLKQLEAAKLDESRDAALIQIVEKAEVPQIKAAPSRRKMVINAGIVVFFVSILFVLFRDSWRNIDRNSELWHKIDNLSLYLDFDNLLRDLHLSFVVEQCARAVAWLKGKFSV